MDTCVSLDNQQQDEQATAGTGYFTPHLYLELKCDLYLHYPDKEKCILIHLNTS